MNMKWTIRIVLLAATFSVPLAAQTLSEQLQKGIYTEETLGSGRSRTHLPSNHRRAGRAALDRARRRAAARAADRAAATQGAGGRDFRNPTNPH